jgi:hypothetical protein
MTTKTDNILAYLPPTFRAIPAPTTLYSVVDAFGSQLQDAENSLASVMMSHWVDYADRGSDFIADLNCFASLYGLAPRGSVKDVAQFSTTACPPVSADETVEQFREHLKRYVRTFIEGTVTVQGTLRIVAESLGLHIEDDYADMDTWWTRGTDLITTTASRGDSIAQHLFGTSFVEARGSAVSAAHVTGKTNLSKGIDLGAGFILRLRVDGGAPVTVDLTGKAKPDEIVQAINNATNAAIASMSGGRLKLASPTLGAKSRIDILDVSHDAAPALLGLKRRTYTGPKGKAATLTGSIDLSHGVDLRAHSKIQLRIDGGPAITVDCAGRNRAKTTLTEIVEGINKAAQRQIARHDGRHLQVVSLTRGLGSGVSLDSFRGDASERIFGIAPRSYFGANASSARIRSLADLSGGIDLRAQHLLQVSIDGGRPIVVDFWTGADDPRSVSITRIRNLLNRTAGAAIASDDGRYLSLSSTLTGPASRIAAGPVTETQVRRFVTRAYITDEAAPIIFGFLRRSALGSAPTSALLPGAVDLSRGVDLRNNRSLSIEVDNAQSVIVDLAKDIPILRGATLPEIIAAINTQLSSDIASQHAGCLILTSPTTGVHSSIVLDPARANDAALLLFGANRDKATGKGPGPAIIRGEIDLSKPVNLADRQTLRIAVDNQSPVDIDVAGVTPGSTFLDEIVTAISRILPGVPSATADDRLLLKSLTAGETSALELLPLRAIEVMEYPPSPVDEPGQVLQHGDYLSIDNDGAAESDLEIQVTASQGEAGMQFVDRAANVRLCVNAAILPGETLEIRRGGDIGVQAEITDPTGAVRTVPESNVLAGTLSEEVQIPFEGSRPLTVGLGGSLTLQLNNPSAPAEVVLRAIAQPNAGERITAAVSLATKVPAKTNAGNGLQRAVGCMRPGAEESYLLNEAGEPAVRLLPGKIPKLAAHAERVVAVDGSLYQAPGEMPIMVADQIAQLFDLTLRFEPSTRQPVIEKYEGVTIGAGARPDSLQLALLRRPSELVRAEELDKAGLLKLSRGKLELTYMNSHASRFDQVKFASRQIPSDQNLPQADDAQFAGGSSRTWVLFDSSRFSNGTPGEDMAFFAPTQRDPGVQVGLHWTRYEPGAFEVNLPAALAEEFGARFDQSRFGLSGQKAETYNRVVTAPDTDPNWIVHRINARSTLISASHLAVPPPRGFEPAVMPFVTPPSVQLSGGTPNEPARLYVVEEGVPGVIELQALAEGQWGNSIVVTAKRSGPVRFDVTVSYKGARFENARQVALAGRILKGVEQALPSQSTQIVKAGPVGVVKSKAAGVRVDVTRDRTEVPPSSPKVSRLGRVPRPGYPYIAFNGVNSYVEAPDSDVFSVCTTGELTISAWIRPETLLFPHDERRGYVNWLGKGEGQGKNGRQEWAFRMYSSGTPETEMRPNRIGFYVFNTSGGLGIGSYFQDPVHPGEWIHVVGAVDGTRTSIFKNGVFRRCDQYRGAKDEDCGRHTFIVTPCHGPAPLRMGHVDGSSYFLGGVSEVRFWNRVLIHKEVEYLYDSNRVPREGLVAEYLLNEGRGDVAHDTVADHDAKIVGAKWK